VGASIRVAVADAGTAVQVEPMKPKLKAPGTERLKLKHDNLPSKLAFKFNLRRYIQELRDELAMVGRCRLTL
jgi:hypothetical protein